MQPESKPWYLSRTIWAGIVAVVISLLRAFQVDLGEHSAEITDGIYNIATAIAALVAIYGRAFASKPIASPKGTDAGLLLFIACLIFTGCATNTGDPKRDAAGRVANSTAASLAQTLADYLRSANSEGKQVVPPAK